MLTPPVLIIHITQAGGQMKTEGRIRPRVWPAKILCFSRKTMWAMNKCSYIQTRHQTTLHLQRKGHGARIVERVGDKI